MRILASDHFTKVVESFSKDDLLELEKIFDLLKEGEFSTLVDKLHMTKVDSAENIYKFQYSHLNIYSTYLMELDILILVDVVSDEDMALDNIDVLKERSLPEEWINVAAYYIAERKKFRSDSDKNWFDARRELVSLIRKALQ